MSVVSEIKKVGPCRRQVSTEVPEAAVETEVQRIVETYRKHAKAPGFRKGRMPESMVRQRFHGEIEKEVLDRLIPRYRNQARAEESLDPLLDRDIQVSSEGFEATLAALARAENTKTVALRQALDQQGRLEGLRMQLRRQKTLGMLLGDDRADEVAAVAAVTAPSTDDSEE